MWLYDSGQKGVWNLRRTWFLCYGINIPNFMYYVLIWLNIFSLCWLIDYSSPSVNSLMSSSVLLSLQKIDEENEANLLAVLTETLDSLPVDEDGLPSFDALTDGDVTTENEASPSSMPDGTPPPQEAEEPSLVRTLPTV